MATSGTRTFSLDVAVAIEEAYELAGLEARTSYDAVTARRSLNIMLADWSNRGIQMWEVTKVSLTLTEGTSEYTINAYDIDILDAYIDWVATLKFINISNLEIDNATFAIAEKKYTTGNTFGKTSKSLQRYLEKFPEGAHSAKALSYLADIFFKTNQFEKARSNYILLLKEKDTEYTETALNKLSQIYLEKEDFKKALPLLKRLEQEGYVLENILFAQSNLMKGYYKTNIIIYN